VAEQRAGKAGTASSKGWSGAEQQAVKVGQWLNSEQETLEQREQ
jgi:hypothetical protein